MHRSRYGTKMRWERLFDEMEAQAREQQLVERDDEVMDLVRGEHAERMLHECLAPGPVRFSVAGFGNLTGDLVRSTPAWLLIAGAGTEAIVNMDWVTRADGPAKRSRPLSVLDQRATWVQVIRTLQRSRSRIHAVSADGTSIDGVVRAAAKDFFEVESDQGRELMVTYRCLAVIQHRDRA